MSLQKCGLNMNQAQKELQPHGTLEFPCAGYASTHTCLPGDDIPWHWHEELEIIYIKEGTLKLQVPSKSHLLKSGDCAVINGNILHYAATDSHCELHSLVFHPSLVTGGTGSVFYQNYLSPLISNAGFTCVLFPAQTNENSVAFCKAFEALRYDLFGYEFIVREELSRICLSVYQQFSDQLNQKKKAENNDSIRIEKMINYMHCHYMEELTLEQIAGSANIGKRECLRCFQRTIGESPIQYLLRHRLMQGAHLLAASPALSISAIASSCGFDHPSYFSKMFRQFYQCSPKEYRNS